MWKEETTQLKKSFEFSTFLDAFTFMTKASMVAQQIKHRSYFYGNVHVVTIFLPLCTGNESPGETENALAEEIDELYLNMKKMR